MPDVGLINFNSPYVPDGNMPVRRASALAWIKHGLSMTELTESHLKEMLSIGLWKWTSAAGVAPYPMYNLRYVSEGALRPVGKVKINHEHVWTRSFLIKHLRSTSWSDDGLRAYLDVHGVACVVTIDEHARLSGKGVEGWERYAQAGIRVWARAMQEWAQLGGSGSSVEHSQATPATVPHEEMPVSTEVAALILERSRPALAALLLDFIAKVRNMDAVEAPSYKETGEPSPYFRVHDAVVGEPTAAVAYPHWTGRVTYRVKMTDLPPALSREVRVLPRQHARYAVQLRIEDAASLELAFEVLAIALQKMRNPDEI